jgi:putative ubiquitin-RnfH superfamily antitoxin RatB of RatAB toxin-antitoxin module
MADIGAGAPLMVVVAWSEQAGQVRELPLEFAPGATVADALAAAGLLHACASGRLQCGVWGRAVQTDAPLRAGDRVEAVRALQVDPKVARRQRFEAQGKRSAGLFTARR